MTKQLEILTWNIKASQKEQLRAHMGQVPADILVLTEYKVPKSGDQLRADLMKLGWQHQQVSPMSYKFKGVLVASRYPLTRKIFPPSKYRRRADALKCAVYVSIPEYDLDLVGLYLPYQTSLGMVADALYASVINLAHSHNKATGLVVAGDFNSTKLKDCESGRIYRQGKLRIDDIFNVLRDSYETFHLKQRPRVNADDRFTFKTGGFARRIDYIFLSENLVPHLISAGHDHSVRISGLSDHSAVQAKLAWKQRDRRAQGF
jgi:exonuclease III